MTSATPPVIVKMTDEFKIVIASGIGAGTELKPANAKIRGKINKNNLYTVRVEGDTIMEILDNPQEKEKLEAQRLETERRARITKALDGAKGFEIEPTSTTDKHLLKPEKAIAAELANKSRVIKFTKVGDEFTLEVATPDGQPVEQWYLAGQVQRTKLDGTVVVKVWHYGPGGV